ncbi:MAG: hypothetical protein ACLFS7_09410, partial [Desulfosudaceae bacterium]
MVIDNFWLFSIQIVIFISAALQPRPNRLVKYPGSGDSRHAHQNYDRLPSYRGSSQTAPLDA